MSHSRDGGNLSTLIKTIMQLNEIVEVLSGFYVRPSSYWDVSYLQAKDFDEFGDLKWKLVPELSSKEVQERQYLQHLDVLFASKGTRNFATVYREKYWKCVASSTFLILRIPKEKAIHVDIKPEYLAILLSEASKSDYFKNNASWAYIQTISKAVLENYEVEIPPLEKQEKVIEFYELYKNQIKLYDKLKEKKEIFTNQLILKLNQLNNVKSN